MEVKTFKLGSNGLCITSATYLFAVYLWMKDGFLGNVRALWQKLRLLLLQKIVSPCGLVSARLHT
jgi:hypothetical protein